MDELDGLLRLAEASWREADSRRSLEWKVSFGLWTALGILSGFLLRGNGDIITIHRLAARILAIFFALGTILVYVFAWTRGIHRKDHGDQRLAHHYWRQAEERLNIVPQHEHMVAKKVPALLADWAHGPQTVFIVVLTLIALLSVLMQISKSVLTHRPGKPTFLS